MKNNKFSRRFKEKHIFILVPICVILIIALMYMYAGDGDGDVDTKKDKEDKKDLVITIPEPNEYGIIRIENEKGEVEHTYSGYFKIHNDGTDGSPVSVGMVIPEGEYIEGSKELPSVIQIYDRSNGKIVGYECSPELKDEVLNLYDASVIFTQDVSDQPE